MRDRYATIATLLRERARFAVATLAATRTSRPAPIGTSLIAFADGEFLGNIGAGCHEAEIVEAARLTLDDGVQRSLEFETSDDLLDGSACGSTLTIVVWKPEPAFAPVAERVVRGDRPVDVTIGETRLRIPPRRRLAIVGATDLASHLAAIAGPADFATIVVDPRPAFASRQRQPHATELIVDWPQDVLPELLPRTDALAVMAHDVKIDLPALRCGLDSAVPYIGALGSLRTQRARRASLAASGYDSRALDRIHGPIGLDLGATTSPQIACAILAEVFQVLNRRSGLSLRDRTFQVPDLRLSPETGEAHSPRRAVAS